jgi:predicted NBD/HSP70 family sugar kinase
MHAEHPSDVSLSISFGGTNIAVGLADRGAKRLLAKSGPLVWRSDPRWDTERALDSLIRLVVDECAGLLRLVIPGFKRALLLEFRRPI